MSDINHEAAKVMANGRKGDAHVPNVANLSRAYLDLDAKLTEMSKYMSDCTPLQSDDFSRGESYGADCCARLINDVLDGKTDGVMCEPLGSARQRLIDHITAERQRVDRLVKLLTNTALVLMLEMPRTATTIKRRLNNIMEGRDNG